MKKNLLKLSLLLSVANVCADDASGTTVVVPAASEVVVAAPANAPVEISTSVPADVAPVTDAAVATGDAAQDLAANAGDKSVGAVRGLINTLQAQGATAATSLKALASDRRVQIGTAAAVVAFVAYKYYTYKNTKKRAKKVVTF